VKPKDVACPECHAESGDWCPHDSRREARDTLLAEWCQAPPRVLLEALTEEHHWINELQRWYTANTAEEKVRTRRLFSAWRRYEQIWILLDEEHRPEVRRDAKFARIAKLQTP
jgi:hypothetical protein